MQLTFDWLTGLPVGGGAVDAGADTLGDDITGAVGQAALDWPGEPFLAAALLTRAHRRACCGQ